MNVAVEAAKKGHNILITGQCGTGKTFLLREVIDRLHDDGKTVAVTSSTGVSCHNLGRGATTLHHWCGIGDGRYSIQVLKRMFDGDGYLDVKKRIKAADVLIIDEIGMTSKSIFETVETVCRCIVMNNNKLFGGLQVIAAGDFKQLPPVPNIRYDDPGQYSFESPIFREVFPHHVNLYQVKRQHELHLVTAVKELCNGDPTPETEYLLRSLSRELPSYGEKVTKIHGDNFDVNYTNQMELNQLPGTEYKFKATDEGKSTLLAGCSAPKNLILKCDAPVILLRNLQGGLYNGMMGKVHSVEGDQPIICLNGRLVHVPKVRFEVFDTRQNKVLACRIQFPLKLAFALTVHRAQGTTLQKVEIDCFSFFAAGQLGVAVGRAVSLNGLRIINYNPHAARLKHPDIVEDFYWKPSQRIMPDLTCCKNDYKGDKEGIGDVNKDDDDDDDDQNEEKREFLVDVESRLCPWSIKDFIQLNKDSSFLPEDPLDSALLEKIDSHASYLYSVMKQLFPSDNSGNDFTMLYRKLHDFFGSFQHLQSLDTISIVPKPQKLSTKLMLWLTDQEIQQKAEEIRKQQTEEDSEDIAPTSEVMRNKIRYIAGACIHKMRQRLRNSIASGKVIHTRKFKMQRMMKNLTLSEEETKNTTEYPDTIHEIDFKQYVSRGLLYVKDSVFEFFLTLHSEVQKQLRFNNLHLKIRDIHLVIRKCLSTNEDLIKIWMDLFEICDDDEDDEYLSMVMDLYDMTSDHYVRISISEGIHAFKEKIPKRKKQALRTKLQALSDTSTTSRKRVSESESASSSKSLRTSQQEPQPSTSTEAADEDEYPCKICKNPCSWEPETVEDDSIACDRCNQWHHFRCVGLKGNENFLKKKSSRWICNSCKGPQTKKGKGKGKGRTQ